MSYKKTVVMLLSVLLLAACSGRGGISKADMESSKRVVVVSLLGDVFHGIQIGTTVFGNNSYDVAVPEWNIDGVVEKTIIAQLGRTSARNVTVLQHDPGLRARMEKTWTAIGGYDYKELLALARQQGADTLILVRPSRYDNAPAHKPGYGFFERNFMGLSRRCFYSLFITSAFSTASGKEMGWEWGFPCESGEADIEWKNGFDQYPADQLQQIRRKTEESVRQNVVKTLEVLGY